MNSFAQMQAALRHNTAHHRLNSVLAMLCIVAFSCIVSSCTSPLDINTARRQTSGPIPTMSAKFLSLTFEGDDVLGVQDGCDVSWYSGITDSVRIDTSNRVSTIGLNIYNINVKNVVMGKYSELQSMSIKFDSLSCSNIAMSIENGMSEINGAEMTVKSGPQSWKFIADGKKTRVSISATEFRPARMVQFRIAVTISEFGFQPQKDLKFNVKGMAVY